MVEGSKPIYTMRSEKNMRVRMRDGILIACDVYRPDADGQFPALFSMSPYGKDIQRLDVPPKPRALGEEWGVIESGDTEYLVERG